jgi:type IV pilus assembly protein PilA
MKNLQTIKHNAQKGFTLIELMIVVAIIGILAALAIPAYQDYTIKSRVSEGASLSGAFKTAVEIYWSENGTLGGIATSGLGGTTLGLSSVKGEYVSDIAFITGPALEVQLATGTSKLGDTPANGGADGGCFTYTPDRPENTGGNLRWDVAACSSNGVPAKFLPKT